MTTQLLYEDDDRGLFTNKSTILANFEEWIRMATDNKINSRNSWNFALIDYFHDLNVLKDSEDNINFQKASATLDGCVKIYSSRVDSVANETGKLLSGLAERRPKQAETETQDEENEGDDSVMLDPNTGLPIGKEDVEEGRKKRNYNRVLETTLVKFDAIKMKELDQELSIDPLFKKALADFDEGGARGLLINALNVDEHLRVVFDATTNNSSTSVDNGDRDRLVEDAPDDVQDTSSRSLQAPDVGEDQDMDEEVEPTGSTGNDESMTRELDPMAVEDELLELGMQYLNFHDLATLELCPSMGQLRAAVQDYKSANTFINDVQTRFENFLTENDMQEVTHENIEVREDDLEYDLPERDDDVLQENGMDYDMGTDKLDGVEQGSQNSARTFMNKEVLAFFDSALQKNWRGREHWKVQNYKLGLKAGKEKLLLNTAEERDLQDPAKDKEKLEPKGKSKKYNFIDFFNLDDNLEEVIFAPSKTSIDLLQKHREDSSHHLLPDDYQFTTDRITKLFTKPNQRMSFFSGKMDSGRSTLNQPDAKTNAAVEHTIADENFWASTYKQNEKLATMHETGQESAIPDSAPLQGIPMDEETGIDFNQAFDGEDLEPFDVEKNDSERCDVPATQNLPRAEDKISYSRTAKRVDVRRLKNNIWKSICDRLKAAKSSAHATRSGEGEPKIELKFTDMASDITAMYSESTRKHLSTSFCFICLLHLANEHGFSITNTENFEDLTILI